MWTELSFVLSQYTRVTDGRTDGRKMALSWLVRTCIALA